MSLVKLTACEIPAGKDIIHHSPSMGSQLPCRQECSRPGSTPRLPFPEPPPLSEQVWSQKSLCQVGFLNQAPHAVLLDTLGSFLLEQFLPVTRPKKRRLALTNQKHQDGDKSSERHQLPSSPWEMATTSSTYTAPQPHGACCGTTDVLPSSANTKCL